MGKKITIYKGTVSKLYAENVVINKDKVLPIEKKIVVNDQAHFYLSFGGYVNIEHACLLADEEEARMYMKSVINRRENKINNILTNTTVSDEDKKSYLDYLSKISSCIYANTSTLKPSYSISKAEFKELRKNMKKRGQ